MSQPATDFAALARAFGPGRDLFDAPDEAFLAVINAIRDGLPPNSILMFLSIESLIRSLKNQRLPAIQTVHDSRWQRNRAFGERMMNRSMAYLVKFTQPPKPNRASKTPPRAVEPTPVVPAPQPEPANATEPAPTEPISPILNPPGSPSPGVEPPPSPEPADANPSPLVLTIGRSEPANLSLVPPATDDAPQLNPPPDSNPPVFDSNQTSGAVEEHVQNFNNPNKNQT